MNHEPSHPPATARRTVSRFPVGRSSVAALLAAGLALTVCSCQKEAAPPPPPPTVEVVAIEQQDVPIYSEFVGTLQADVNATISAQVTGYIKSRDYVEGTNVTQGQLLFQIDDGIYRATLQQAQAKLDKSTLDVERYTELAKSQAISQQELDDAKLAKQANQAAVDQATLNVSYCKITSPIGGVAGLAQAQIGDLVGPNTGPLTTVTKVDPIRVYFSVAQQLLTQLMEQRLAQGKNVHSRQETPLELVLAGGSVYPSKGAIRFNDNQVDVKTGTIRVVGEFENKQGLLVPGMFVRVRATIGETKGALVVPQRAVAELQGRRLIALVGADNKVAIRPVTTGATSGDKWIIRGPFKAGDRVVAEGIQKVRDGMTVNPVPFGSIAAEKSAPGEKSEPKP